MENELPAPNPPATNNAEAYLAMLAGVEGLSMPSTINNNVEYYLRYLVENGGGGTNNYPQLSNKPQVNSITLIGNKSLDDLGIQAKIDAEHKLSADNVDDTSTTNKFVTASDKVAWNAKQNALVSGTNIKTINNTTILGSGDIDTNSIAVNTLSGTAITLTDNSVNTLTPTGNTTFTLPTVTDTTVFHQILVQLNLTTVYTIALGTSTYFGGTAPDLSATGNYNLVYEYDNALSAWVVGCIDKGV